MKAIIEINRVDFNIPGHHESHTGTAIIVASYRDGIKEMTTRFEGTFKTNNIGIQQDGVRDGSDLYSVYENYQDSGSDNYHYFAVKIED